ncbi:exodeoxyribonuclease I [Candidatus Erwinia haradaeae]|uniref:Exodeoxyribonuclease I n=1 Tax=Candidatus Erwinia haradaeae TaxID=1922217 RepID=A0A451D991_9GAMM|nr:exodeoxyribonuclease I [Candidatus Erwinia haradaeae]VFP82793.1 Exodeoxyribonuclease I [Candidatus Erwinia haradaeae]
MQPTLLFYDYETFGTSPSLDRPAQFAAIRTDINLNPIGESEVIYCWPANDYLPQPEAVLITGITPQLTYARGVNEAEFAQRIHKIFCVPNTCIVGYNNIHFDDEISRYLFYRNFYDPYSWSWKNQNSRWDLLYVTRACYALRPNGIKWPKNEDGFPSFRLERITQENDIVHRNAHDALSDVYATIRLARLIKSKQPKLYHFFYAHRHKNKLKKLIKIPHQQILVYISSIFGKKRGNATCVSPLAWHPYNQNALITCDLSKDITSLIALNSEMVSMNVQAAYDAIHEAPDLPLQLIYMNKCPMIAPAHTLRDTDAQRIGADLPFYLNNFARLNQHPEISQNVMQLYKKKPEHLLSDNVDTQLYESFFNDADRHIIDVIRHTPIENTSNLNLIIYDTRIKKLLFRFRARNFPFSLTSSEKQDWLEYRRNVFHPTYMQEYVKKIHTLYEKYRDHDDKKILLQDLLEYAKKLTSSLNTNDTLSDYA